MAEEGKLQASPSERQDAKRQAEEAENGLEMLDISLDLDGNEKIIITKDQVRISHGASQSSEPEPAIK